MRKRPSRLVALAFCASWLQAAAAQGTGDDGGFTWFNAPGAGYPRPAGQQPAIAGPEFLRRIDGQTSPEAFPLSVLQQTFFDVLSSLSREQAAAGESFLTRDVGLSKAEAQAVVAAARVSKPRSTIDPKIESKALCEAASNATSPRMLADTFQALNARELAQSAESAASSFALLDMETQSKLRSWMTESMRPRMQRMEIDYEKYFAQPGVLDAMKKVICDAAQRLDGQR